MINNIAIVHHRSNIDRKKIFIKHEKILAEMDVY